MLDGCSECHSNLLAPVRAKQYSIANLCVPIVRAVEPAERALGATAKYDGTVYLS